MKTNKTLGLWHLRKSIETMEVEFNQRIHNMYDIINELEAKQEDKNQTKLSMIYPQVHYAPLEKFLIEDRRFTTYDEFDTWARKVRPTVVCECAFTSTGDQYTYQEIRDIAKKCLSKPDVEVV